MQLRSLRLTSPLLASLLSLGVLAGLLWQARCEAGEKTSGGSAPTVKQSPGSDAPRKRSKRGAGEARSGRRDRRAPEATRVPRLGTR